MARDLHARARRSPSPSRSPSCSPSPSARSSTRPLTSPLAIPFTIPLTSSPSARNHAMFHQLHQRPQRHLRQQRESNQSSPNRTSRDLDHPARRSNPALLPAAQSALSSASSTSVSRSFSISWFIVTQFVPAFNASKDYISRRYCGMKKSIEGVEARILLGELELLHSLSVFPAAITYAELVAHTRRPDGSYTRYDMWQSYAGDGQAKGIDYARAYPAGPDQILLSFSKP